MKKIVTIGGGRETQLIDEEIIKLSGKKNPKFLFIPTASSDDQGYVEHMRLSFGEKLGCIFDTLLLISHRETEQRINEKIMSADIIYVGGGNTLAMMRLWRKLGVDLLLKAAYEKGTVMCGLSAGSICWYEFGHSDSMSYYNPNEWEYIKVRGLGFIKGIHCPHFDSETLSVPRRENFKNMIGARGGFGLAVEDNCALVFIDDAFKVVSSKERAAAYKVYKRNGSVISEKIEPCSQLTPVEHLYKK